MLVLHRAYFHRYSNYTNCTTVCYFLYRPGVLARCSHKLCFTFGMFLLRIPMLWIQKLSVTHIPFDFHRFNYRTRRLSPHVTLLCLTNSFCVIVELSHVILNLHFLVVFCLRKRDWDPERVECHRQEEGRNPNACISNVYLFDSHISVTCSY